MSKQCTGDYKYKGFLIRFSEYYEDWFIESSFLFKEFGNDVNVCNFITNSQFGEFETINQAKEYIQEDEQGLKARIRLDFLNSEYNTNAHDDNYYLEAFKELEKVVNENPRNLDKIQELTKICKEGQEKGIKELQRVV